MSLRRVARQSVQWVRRQEGLVLVAALAVVLALFVFIRVTEEMLEGDTREFDEWLLRSLRDQGQPEVPIGPQWLIAAARDITVLGRAEAPDWPRAARRRTALRGRRFAQLPQWSLNARGGCLSHARRFIGPLRWAAKSQNILPRRRASPCVPRRKQQGVLGCPLSHGRPERVGGWPRVGTGLLAHRPIPAISGQGGTARDRRVKRRLRIRRRWRSYAMNLIAPGLIDDTSGGRYRLEASRFGGGGCEVSSVPARKSPGSAIFARSAGRLRGTVCLDR